MKIGIDLDDTICNTFDNLSKYVNEYTIKYNIPSDKLWEIDKYKEDFLNKYLKGIYETAIIKENASEYIKKIKDNNNEIYIITARTTTYTNNIIEITRNYLEKYHIEVDKILIDAKDKVDACIKHNIDYMIDDNYYNITKLRENNIKAILFDDKNKYPKDNLKISNWNEILNIIK